ncbi:uncharacterized protein LOC116616207 [Nematostella vectensis]|uniref:uncharacterized protein LOC116616207 n=1 Tax=Nematostella vectensis TaxID=45351 RepID=UPI002076E37A|nr:uncharacterized protein LOC116616207 [Nematostella vectensis]
MQELNLNCDLSVLYFWLLFLCSVRSGVRVCIASFSRLARSYRRQRLLRLRGESRSSQHSAEWYKDGYIIGDRQLPKSRIIQVGKDVYVVTLRKRRSKKRKRRRARDEKSNELLRVQGKKSKRKSSVRDIWAPNKRTERKQKRVKKWVRRNAYKLISRHIPRDMCSSKVDFSGKDISKKLRFLDCSRWLTELRVLDCSRWLTELRGSGYGGMLSLFMADRDEQAPLRDHTSSPVTGEGNAAGNGTPDGTTPVPNDQEGSGNTEGRAPVANEQKGSGNIDGTTPVPNDQEGSGNTDGTAPVQNEQEGSGDTDGTTPVQNDQEVSGNTYDTAPVQNEQEGSGNTDGTAPVQNDQEGFDSKDSLGLGCSEADHPTTSSQTQDVCDTSDSQHQSQQSLDTAINEILSVSVDDMSPDAATNSSGEQISNAAIATQTSCGHVTSSASDVPAASGDQVTQSASDFPTASGDQVTQSASDVPTTSDDQVTPPARDVPTTSDDQVTPSASDVQTATYDQVTPSASDVPTTSDDQVTPSASDVLTAKDDQVTPSARDDPTTSDDQVTPSDSDVPTTSDDQVTLSASDVPTTSDDQITPSASDVPTTSDDKVTLSASDVPTTSDDQVTLSASDVPTTSDDPVTPSASDVTPTSDDQVTPSAIDIPTAKDDKVTLSAMNVPTAKDDKVTLSASDVPTTSDDQVTLSASDVTPTSDNQVTLSPRDIPTKSDDQVTPSGKIVSPAECNIDYQDQDPKRGREIATVDALKDSVVLAPAEEIIDDVKSTIDTTVKDKRVHFALDTITNVPVITRQPHTSVIAARKAAESSSAQQPPLHPDLLETTTATNVTPSLPATKPTKVAPSPEPKRREIKITAWNDGECSFSATQNDGKYVSPERATVGAPSHSADEHTSSGRPGLVLRFLQGLRRIMNNRNIVVPTVTYDRQTNVLLSLSVIDPSALAEELTMIDSEMLREIEFDEIKGGVWRTSEMEQRSPHVHAMIQFYNNLSAICVTEILSKEKTKDRAHVIAKIIKIAEKCALMNNFNSCKALLSSFRFHVISRLSDTWKKVSTKAKSTKAHLLAQMSSLDDIAIMRRHQRVCLKRGVNSIQFLGDILHQVHYIEECFSQTSDASDQPATGECYASTSTVKDGDTSVVSTVKDGDTPVVSTVKDGDTPVVSTVKDGDTPVVSTVKDGDTPVVSTVKDGDTPVVSTVKDGDTPVVSTVKDGDTPVVSSVKDGDTSVICQAPTKGMTNIASNLPSKQETDPISSNPTENSCHTADADLSNNCVDPSSPVLPSNPRQGSCTHDALEDELRQMWQTYQDAAQGYRFSRRPAVKAFLLNATINDPEDNVDRSYGLEHLRKSENAPDWLKKLNADLHT